MKNKTSQNGAISIFVMSAMIFLIVTVLGIYMVNAKRAQTQNASIKSLKDDYYKDDQNDDINPNNSSDNLKIYNKEQLWNVEANKTYQLQNDIIINISELKNANIKYLTSTATISYGNYNVYYYHNNDYYVLNKYYNGSSNEYTRAGSLKDVLFASGENFATISTTIPSRAYYSFAYKNLSEDIGYVTDGLILHYDGIKNTATGHSSTTATWKDLSGTGNDGNLNECAWNESFLNFDGQNDYVNAHKIDLKDNTSFTYDVVLFFNTNQNHSVIMGNFSNEIGGSVLGIDDIKDNYLKFHTKSYSNHKINSTKGLNDDKKHHISAIYNRELGKLYLYIDGKLDQSGDVSNDLNYPDLNFCIGMWSSTNTQFFKGNIYSMKVYNKALSEQEIVQNFNIDNARFKIQ